MSLVVFASESGRIEALGRPVVDSVLRNHGVTIAFGGGEMRGEELAAALVSDWLTLTSDATLVLDSAADPRDRRTPRARGIEDERRSRGSAARRCGCSRFTAAGSRRRMQRNTDSAISSPASATRGAGWTTGCETAASPRSSRQPRSFAFAAATGSSAPSSGASSPPASRRRGCARFSIGDGCGEETRDPEPAKLTVRSWQGERTSRPLSRASAARFS